MALDTRALLEDAMSSATLDRLHATLKRVCKDSAEAFNIACDELLISPRMPLGNNKENEDAGNIAGQKRKRDFVTQRYEICEQCDQEFDVTKNKNDSCTWHEGDLEPDYEGDFWADHDEDCHGEIDSDDMRKEFPEGFRWDCCNKLGDEPGCRTTEHTASPAKKIKV